MHMVFAMCESVCGVCLHRTNEVSMYNQHGFCTPGPRSTELRMFYTLCLISFRKFCFSGSGIGNQEWEERQRGQGGSKGLQRPQRRQTCSTREANWQRAYGSKVCMLTARCVFYAYFWLGSWPKICIRTSTSSHSPESFSGSSWNVCCLFENLDKHMRGIRLQACACSCVYIYIHAHKRTHKYIDTFIHIYIYACRHIMST